MSNLKVLYNPFERYSERRLLLFAITAFLIGSFLAYFTGGRFDGIIDLHFSKNVILWMPFVDNLIDTGVLFLVFSLMGKFLNRKARLIDILAVSGVSRYPLYLITLTNIDGINLKASEQLLPLVQDAHSSIPVPSLILVLVFSLVGILCIVWFGALLYKGFKIATNAKGRSLIVGTVLGIILAEAVSKFIFIYVF